MKQKTKRKIFGLSFLISIVPTFIFTALNFLGIRQFSELRDNQDSETRLVSTISAVPKGTILKASEISNKTIEASKPDQIDISDLMLSSGSTATYLVGLMKSDDTHFES